MSNGISTDKKLSELNGDISGIQNVKIKVLQNDGTLKDVSFSFNADDTVKSVISKINKKWNRFKCIFDEKTGNISLSTVATGSGADYTVDKNTVKPDDPSYDTLS